MNSGSSTQGKRLAATFGFRWDIQNLRGRNWFNAYLLKFAKESVLGGIMETTKVGLRQVLNTGMAQGWSIEATSNAINDLFGVWLGDRQLTDEQREWFTDRLPQYRLEAIARTETIRASNAGSVELYKEWVSQSASGLPR